VRRERRRRKGEDGERRLGKGRGEKGCQREEGGGGARKAKDARGGERVMEDQQMRA